mmetsp:Transcript_20086/g.28281  ORF Transcript_20086/g.28281 Transcript_20086/m.28281 type:complete len:195 (-) Transcript_20086:193-777(-)
MDPKGWHALLDHARLLDYVSGVQQSGVKVEDIFEMEQKTIVEFIEEKLKISKRGHIARLRRSIEELRDEWFPKKEEVDNETKSNQEEGMSKSTKYSHSMTFTATNKTPKKMSAYWVDYHGVEKKYWSLNPGQTKSQQTFVTHPWKLRNAEDNKLVGWFVVKETDCDDDEKMKRKAIRRHVCIENTGVFKMEKPS